MRATDLRIMDWYAWEAEGKLYYYQVTKETFTEDEAVISNFQPIPLTYDILERNHFRQCIIMQDFCIDLERKPYKITNKLYVLDGVCGTMVCSNEGGLALNPLFECKYVHQLQHILDDSGILQDILV